VWIAALVQNPPGTGPGAETPAVSVGCVVSCELVVGGWCVLLHLERDAERLLVANSLKSLSKVIPAWDLL
jgi:hypothetical protein